MGDKRKIRVKGRKSVNSNSINRREESRESALGRDTEALFYILEKEGKGTVSVQTLMDNLAESGISKNDPRLKACLDPYLQKEDGLATALDPEQFNRLLQGPNGDLIRRAVRKELAIPYFMDFKNEIREIYEQAEDHTEGKVDTSLPHPPTDGSPAYAVSICTVDGQLLQLGDHELAFSIQSICKPLNYAIALEELGEEAVHRHVGVEPGGENFDTGMVLNENNLPHNPLINSGAIMTASLIRSDLDMEHRLQHVMEVWKKLSGDKAVAYKEEAFLTERKSANKNFALAHLMKERGAFPDDTELTTTLDFYLKCCAIEVEVDALAHVAASLANYGLCPTTGKKVFQHDTVKNTLSLMLSSGMYDHSGEFAFWAGMPSKSGIAGGMMIVVPNLLGIAVYSPPLDEHGNSKRAVAFCEKLVEKFNFHIFDAVGTPEHGKKDPRLHRGEAGSEKEDYLFRAASKGDLAEIRMLLAQGVPADLTNYDGRTALHLAAAEGHHLLVDFLLKEQVEVNVNPRDRWGHTPLAEAIRFNRTDVINLLRENGGEED